MGVQEIRPTQHDTERHTGPLGSGGHGYNSEATEPSTEYPNRDRTEDNVGETPASARATVGGQAAPTRLGRGFWVGLGVAGLLLAGLVVYGIHARTDSEHVLGIENTAASIPEVKVVYPSGAGGSGTLSLPGNTQAYVDTPIYSRTNGYLQKWFFDIGAHVRKGQLMATIETPELDQQLQVAEADLKSSQANLNLAKITSERYQNLLKSNSVSKQETDVAVGNAESKEAAVEASLAGVRRLQQLQSFERVYAPFSGIVTSRTTDTGALITGGTAGGGAAKELFHLASIDRLRVFVSVPEGYSGVVRNGGTATLTLDEYPGETFSGMIARNASSIDPASRTLNVEVDVNNAAGKLLPGAYVMVHFNVANGSTNLSIPANTLLFRAEGLRVGVVRDGRVQLVPVRIAQDHGATVEVAAGLSAQDALIADPSDSLIAGQQVKVKPAGASK